MLTSGHRRARRSLAGVSIVVTLAIAAIGILGWQPVGVAGDYAFTDLLKAAIELKIDQSRSEFQLGLVAFGALWALMIAKSGEAGIVLSDTPELVMFCLSNGLLVLSSVFHFWYVDNVSYIYWLAGGIEGGKSIPDIASAGINNPFTLQFWSLLGGMGIAAITLFSAHKLK